MKIAVLLLCIVFFGCSSPLENREAYLKKRGVQYIKLGEVELTSRLLSAKECTSYSNSEYLYFDVMIDKLTESEFDKEKSMYLDFDMQQDFVAGVDRDSIAPAFCQRIQSGKKDRYEYIVAIKKPEVENTGVTLVYNDKIFGVGKVAFVYEGKDLKNFEPKS